MLTFIPKIEEAMDMKHFRPISLINCSFKIFSKVMTWRLGRVSQRFVSHNQSAFIKGRYIMESVVIDHEVVHSVQKSQQPRVILKLYYEKAYDRVSLSFVYSMMAARGFSNKWIDWMKNLVMGGSIGVKLTGEESSYFKPGKGLRQGDPISPLLFNLVCDVLTTMLVKAEKGGLIKGPLPKSRRK
jgi:hypothetical protein